MTLHLFSNDVAQTGRLRNRLVRASAGVAATVLVSLPALGSDLWHEASRVSGVPIPILHGIALTESGKVWTDGSTRPWPWTLNSPVKGPQFFKSREAAAEQLLALLNAGVTNIDIGLMQVNCGYHCKRVKAPEDLLDPAVNLRVASQILSEVRAAKGDLASAVGAYHAGLSPNRLDRSKWYQNAVAVRVRRLRAGANG